VESAFCLTFRCRRSALLLSAFRHGLAAVTGDAAIRSEKLELF